MRLAGSQPAGLVRRLDVGQRGALRGRAREGAHVDPVLAPLRRRARRGTPPRACSATWGLSPAAGAGRWPWWTPRRRPPRRDDRVHERPPEWQAEQRLQVLRRLALRVRPGRDSRCRDAARAATRTCGYASPTQAHALRERQGPSGPRAPGAAAGAAAAGGGDPPTSSCAGRPVAQARRGHARMVSPTSGRTWVQRTQMNSNMMRAIVRAGPRPRTRRWRGGRPSRPA